MYIVGQPRRLSEQAERLPHNVGSRLPDYFFGPICSVPDKSCWKSGRSRIGSHTGSIFKRAMEATWPAALARRRNCRSSLFLAGNLLHERFEAQIAAKIVEEWISREEEQVAFVASLKAVLERFNGAFFFA